ncbi:MAG: ExeA family protein [Usitatibacter sp.]
MYLEHFGLREAPFRITPHTEFFFSGANRGATLEALLYAITAGEGLVKVTGEVGSGKTMLCRVLMERLPETVEIIYLAVPSLSRDEMLAAIAGDLGLETAGANTTKLIRLLQDKLIEIHAAGRQVVALIDEAHAMPLATLEEIRLLSNLETGTEKLLQIVLFGQPELNAHLALEHMRQLKERITHGFSLAPLPPRDVKDYLNFRMRAAGYHGPDLFGPEVLRIINEASEGLTRRINIYADKTLLAAFAAGTHSVTADHARAAVTDTQIVLSRRESPRRLAIALAATAAAGIVIGFTAAQFVRAPTAPAAVAAAPSQAPATAIPAAATGPAPAATAAPPLAKAAPAPAQKIAYASAEADRSSRSLDARIAAGRALLDSDSQAYTVQLMVADARERAYLENYLADAGRTLPPDQLFVVAAGLAESPRLALLYGTFPGRIEAATALAALPEGLRQFRPYLRPLEAVRDDARRAAPK